MQGRAFSALESTFVHAANAAALHPLDVKQNDPLLHVIVPHLHGAAPVPAVLPSRVEQLVKDAAAVQVLLLLVHESPITQVPVPQLHAATVTPRVLVVLAHAARADDVHAFLALVQKLAAAQCAVPHLHTLPEVSAALPSTDVHAGAILQ